MTPGMGQYGLGTMLFASSSSRSGRAYGHRGRCAGYTSLLVAGSNISVALCC